VYGPPPGTRAVVFVDDLNMPMVEEYGAQPPIELLRQMIDNNGWYNLEDNMFMQLVDTMLVAAMGPPVGGRNPISARIKRHFNAFCFTEIPTDTLKRIFSSIIDWFADGNDFAEAVRRVAKQSVVSATLDLYSQAQESLRPTPAKSHYTFNLRDFSRVVQGVLMAKPADVDTPQVFARLWCHEVMRVFYDRLTDQKDRGWLIDELGTALKEHFGEESSDLFADLPELKWRVIRRASKPKKREGDQNGNDGDNADDSAGNAGQVIPAAAADSDDTPPDDLVLGHDEMRLLFWGDFFTPGATKRNYRQVGSADELIGAVEVSLEDYNSQSKNPMDLVPFLFFLEHVSRIARVLKMPGGHSLLVGVGGSGRQCATRLATFMAGYKLLTIELSKSYGTEEWQEDMKRIMKESGTGPSPCVLLFNDTQIKWQGMVEDINNVLNSGEVPNLFAADERAEIYEAV